MTEIEPGSQGPTGLMWTSAPEGIYLPKIALVNWTRIHSPRLTILPEAAVLEGYVTESLGDKATDAFECVAEAVGWRWRFRGIVEAPVALPLDAGESRVPVIVRSLGPITSEAAPSGRALQV